MKKAFRWFADIVLGVSILSGVRGYNGVEKDFPRVTELCNQGLEVKLEAGNVNYQSEVSQPDMQTKFFMAWQRYMLDQQFFGQVIDASSGIRNVVYHVVPESQYTLVHVRRRHRNTFGIDTPESDGLVKIIDGEVYNFLSVLVTQKNLQYAYPEGYTDFLESIKELRKATYELTKATQEFTVTMRELKRSMDSLSGTVNNAPEEEVVDIPLPEYKETIAEENIIYDAIWRLKSEGKLDVHVCGTMEAEQRALIALSKNFINILQNKPKDSEFDFEVCENRENIALGFIAQYGDPFNVIGMGGDHNFTNNVDEWNEQHPDQKFSLITVTPVSYKE
ncbi:MAG: hypothetical protein Q7R96_00430 [Nanoarchaeota archaeon]|nr:hypothetical protein [Nanoarchaeota archaeon]